MNSEPTGPLRPPATELVRITEKRSGGLAASGELVPASEEIIRYSNIPIELVDSIETFYDLGRTIGRGEFAKVKLARCRVTQQLVGERRGWYGKFMITYARYSLAHLGGHQDNSSGCSW